MFVASDCKLISGMAPMLPFFFKKILKKVCWLKKKMIMTCINPKGHVLGSNKFLHPSVQFSSATQLCLTLCDPMDWSTPGCPVHYQLPELAQTHVHQVSDVIQSSHSLSPLLLLPSIFPSIRVSFWHWLWSNTLRMKLLSYIWIYVKPYGREGRWGSLILKGRDAWTQDEMESSPDVTSNPRSFTNLWDKKVENPHLIQKQTLKIPPGIYFVHVW